MQHQDGYRHCYHRFEFFVPCYTMLETRSEAVRFAGYGSIGEVVVDIALTGNAKAEAEAWVGVLDVPRHDC